MRMSIATGAAFVSALVAGTIACAALQTPAIRPVDEAALREYAGVYQWGSDAFVYLQLWDEFSGFGKPRQLVAFDESGEIRTLYPTERDRFFAGPGAGISASVESRIEFQRAASGQVTSLTWQHQGVAPRSARRVDIEKREDVRFSNDGVRLAGTLIGPADGKSHPAIILVHGSGAENRDYVLPFARFLVRRGVAVLGYDKRGVGESTGDWNTASFDELAGDVVAAFQYLKTRRDIDRRQIGLLGISQAGWVMPLAAVRARDMAFLISVSGAGVPPSETTIDQAENEMTASGMRPQTVADIIALMRVQYRFARTGHGWDEYIAARQTLAARFGGTVPDSFPAAPDDPYWQRIRQQYFYDPGPTLRQLEVPTLAIFGELDNNILAQKNRAAWEAALKAGGNRDYLVKVLPRANHYQWEAKIGSNAEMASLKRFVPEYYTTIHDWLAKRIEGFEASR
jgi:pimeloyl-ACP methyl ester carboxylesterase